MLMLEATMRRSTGFSASASRRTAVHALADPDGGGEMIDGIDVAEGAADGLRIADIADLEFHFVGEVGGAPGIGTVDLRDEEIEDPDVVAVVQQFVRKMGADEARPPCDQYFFPHPVPPKVCTLG
jgi:hypothetical protein